MNENYLAMTEGVKEFLMELGLEQYYDIFVTKGFDCESDVKNLQDDDLDAMGISDPNDRQLLLTAAQHYSPSEAFQLYTWLRQHHLDYYLVNFVQSDLTDFKELANLQLPDEQLYDELEIVLPGHRKRLERAVRQLRKRRRLDDSSPEEPLALGRWGKPSALVDAKYDFLCVEAVISSTKHPENTKRMDFMVDSGSDVVTLREEVLESLDLELLGTVRSKGVHASREKRLYKAKLLIGSSQIEIEVMPESYDSLGSRVIRHFRHFIDGNRHIWLPGNYIEPALVLNAEPSREEGISATGSLVATENSLHSEDVRTTCAETVRSIDIPTAIAESKQSTDIPTTLASPMHSADISITPASAMCSVDTRATPTESVHSADIPSTLASQVHSADISTNLKSVTSPRSSLETPQRMSVLASAEANAVHVSTACSDINRQAIPLSPNSLDMHEEQ